MIFLAILALDKCDDEHPCIHGTCNFLKICSCEGNYGGSYCDQCLEQYTGENCGECAEGFVLAEEMGQQKCVSPICLDENNITCYSHGDCHKEKDTWACRCVRHYDAAKKCKTCSSQHFEVVSGDVDQCVHKNCLDSAHEVVCSNNGYCSFIEIPIILPAKCHCNTPNMDKMCSACANGYMEYNHTIDQNGTIVVDQTFCKLNFCGDDANCNGDSERCVYTATTDQYQCVCPDNYDFRTFCATCVTNYDLESGCTKCSGINYDEKSACTQCIYGYSLESNCTTCLGNYDMATNCTTCLKGHTLQSRCTECEAGFEENGDGLCISTNKGANTAWIVVGVIAGVVVLIAAIAGFILCARSRNTQKYERTGSDEDNVLMQDIDQ